jgi:hypothetical protein
MTPFNPDTDRSHAASSGTANIELNLTMERSESSAYRPQSALARGPSSELILINCPDQAVR